MILPPGRSADCNTWLGVAAEPVREMCRTQAWIVARRQASVVHCQAVVERLRIGSYRPRGPGFSQELPNEFVLTDRVGTGQLDYAVQWLRERRLGHGGSDVVSGDGLHQSRWDPACQIGRGAGRGRV